MLRSCWVQGRVPWVPVVPAQERGHQPDPLHPFWESLQPRPPCNAVGVSPMSGLMFPFQLPHTRRVVGAGGAP